MMGAVINAVNKSAMLAQQGFHLVVNMAKSLVTAIATGDHRLVRHHTAAVFRPVQAFYCIFNARDEFQLIRVLQMIDFPVDGSITINKNHRLRTVKT